MGSGDWLKTIIHRKKTKQINGGSSNQDANGSKQKGESRKDTDKVVSNGAQIGKTTGHARLTEQAAAIRIQTAYRRYKARKTLRSLKRYQRLQGFTSRNSVQKQTCNTSFHIKSWSKIQTEIRARRATMVVEGRIRQKKHENQLKLEAKIHDVETEWDSGADTKEEILARIMQREEAAVKRERAMAYAFSHQWRANSGMNPGPLVYELANGNWEWSWVDKWIAGQPWQARPSSAQSADKRSPNKVAKSSSKPTTSDGKVSLKKPPSKQPDEETTSKESNSKQANPARSKTKSTKTKQEQQPSQVSEIAVA